VVGVDPPHLCWIRRVGLALLVRDFKLASTALEELVEDGECPVEVLVERSSGRAPVPGPGHDPSR
jgi:hypothetical protein